MPAPESAGLRRIVSPHSLLVASSVMAAGTLISRLLGLVRQSLQMSALGADRRGDVFQMATTLPNTAFGLIAGGALNAVLVPLLVRATKEDDDSGDAFISRLLTGFCISMLLATLACVALTPILLRVNNSAWFRPENSAYLSNLTLLTYLTMPQIFFFGIFLIVGQVLNARGVFGPMMWGPILNNLIGIGTFLLFLRIYGVSEASESPFTSPQILLLGLGATLGVVGQAAFLLFFLKRAEIHFRPRFDFRDDRLRRAFTVTKWAGANVALNTAGALATGWMANGATLRGSGGAGQAVLNSSNLVWMAVHGLITVSVTTASLPEISSAYSDGLLTSVASQTTRTMNLVQSVIIPTSITLVVLSKPSAELLFGYGRGHDAIPALSKTLMASGAGLPFYTAVFVLARTLFAVENTRATTWSCLVSNALWVLLSACFTQVWGRPELIAPAIAWAYALANIPDLVVTHWLARGSIPALQMRPMLLHAAKVTAACLPGGLAAGAFIHYAGRYQTGKLALLLVCSGASVLVFFAYWGMARLLHVDGFDGLAGRLRRLIP